MEYTVQVLDENGKVLFSKSVKDPLREDVIGTNGANQISDPVAAALYRFAPEVCPWDCESCNG